MTLVLVERVAGQVSELVFKVLFDLRDELVNAQRL